LVYLEIGFSETGSLETVSTSGESANFRFLASINPPESYRVRRIRILAILAVCKIGYRPERVPATEVPAITAASV